mgnify:CR=1 FL=1
MEKTSIKKIIKYRNELITRLRSEGKQLDYVDEKEQEEIKKRMRFYNRELNRIEEVLYQGSYLRSADFAVFLMKFLNLTEGHYTLAEFTSNQHYRTEEPMSIVRISGKKNGRKYYVVSDEATYEFLTENIDSERKLLQFMGKQKPSNTFFFVKDHVYPFYNDLIMKREYRSHPRLKTAIYELIQLKLDHPDMSDKDRMETVLNNTVRRNLNRSYKSTKQKSLGN